MTIEQARRIDLVAFIERLGHRVVPGKGKQGEAWFLSPFRTEKTPSFKVDRRANKWKDFAEQYWKGDIVDFVQVYADKQGWGSWDTSQALKELERLAGSLHVPSFKPYKVETTDQKPKARQRYEIMHVGRIRSVRLVEYLRSRKIYSYIAKQYLEEVHYRDTRTGKHLYGLCWKNTVGGYEMRNPFFKTCLGPKAISVIQVVGETVPGTAIFEGMMDFLSYLLLLKGPPVSTVVVMNSRSLYQSTIEYCQSRNGIGCLLGFLQNDKYGLETAVKLKEALPSLLLQNQKYVEYEDVNDYLTAKKQSSDQVEKARNLLEKYL